MNAETKWTPGPWARIDTPDYAEIHPASGKAKSPIALVGRAEDADLIAAAPEMAEALRPFAALLEIFEQKAGNRPLEGEICSWIDHRVGERTLTVEQLVAARAALKKAGG